ncbi:S-methyl-5'-thioadenosine phosphorylase [Thermocrinis minervae]|uniref:Probable 6-oxopurine nucleoside phosphorylase n=1 Tax=Thermocrinis minervae TaxID=381751 RepID=A0A1M6RGS6_9AQUI|nr:S-methyl-5'-thioadenosine phosphorylase [Thermocrinis minervae]SHK31620.1 methylthioadenosine phosphorylase [Thermocrinis minervae]
MLGVIGGSGLYSIEGLKVVEEVDVSTPFGKPSSTVVLCELEDRKIAFISRHGKGHSIPPHLVPYRANLWALKEVGVKRVLGIFAVGGISHYLKPGDYVVVDDFIEFTKGRVSTFYEGAMSVKVEGKDRPSELLKAGKVVHIDLSQPYCPQMRKVLIDVLEELRLPYHSSGVYACTEGPRFETPAEIRAIRLLGGDVVGMTGYPEVVLARELEMCYSALCVVANPAAGISSNKLTSDEVIQMMKQKEEEIKEVIKLFVKNLPEERVCPCPSALEGAVV